MNQPHEPRQWPNPQDPYGQYHAQLTPKAKRKKWPWVFGGLMALAVVIGISSQEDETPPLAGVQQAAPASEASSPTYDTPEPYQAPEPSYPTLERGETYTSGGTAGIGSGTHIVGVDIEPGTYRSQGAEEGFFEFCSWSTKKGASSNSDVIDFGTANANEPMVVEIGQSVKAFDSNNCEPWTKVE